MNQLRQLAPQVLGALVRRYGDFAGAEDAVQEALIEAATVWPKHGEPDDPRAWLIRVARRRLANQYRADAARRRREVLAASWSMHQAPEPAPNTDDTLVLMMMCCHPSLSAGSAIPLTLRAIGGLTTREIASAFLVSEATMAQRISRAKAKLREFEEPFQRPSGEDDDQRTRSVLHVLYLIFNEGYATSAGTELGRPDLAVEATRLTRMLLQSLPDDAELEGLLAVMLLSEARRPARTTAEGTLVPLAEQDRSRWNRDLITEGLTHATAALQRAPTGEYALQAAINALHAQAPSHEATRWADIATLYERLVRVNGSPVAQLNHAIAVAMVKGPDAGLALLADLEKPLEGYHRLFAVRAHLHEQSGDGEAAITDYRLAASHTANVRERDYLILQAARVATYGCRSFVISTDLLTFEYTDGKRSERG